jgi:hypothetical protein
MADKAKTVQRPDLADLHGTGEVEETHREGEHAPGDTSGSRGYTGEHGGKLPRPGPKR